MGKLELDRYSPGQNQRPALPPSSGLSRSAAILLQSSLRRPISVLTLMAMDALTLLAGLLLAGYLVGGGESRVWGLAHLTPVFMAILLAVFAAHDLYNKTQSRRNPVALMK